MSFYSIFVAKCKKNYDMNIHLFVQSLSELEQKELRNYFAINPEILTTKDFINKYKMSNRLRNILEYSSDDDGIFKYVSQFNRVQFLKLPNAGERSWDELVSLIEKNKK